MDEGQLGWLCYELLVSEIRPLKALVTGATGFVGSAVAKRLQKENFEIRAMVRDPSKLAAVGLAGVDVAVGDITDKSAVAKACDGCDIVYSIAGTFREPDLSDARYREINVDAVRHMLDGAHAAGIKRVVHCSTVGIHGNVIGPPATEDNPIVPDGIYEITKAEGDRVAREYGQELGLEVVVIRPTPIYGPGDTRLLKLFKMASKDPMIMLGDGTAGYHLVHIDDLAEAFLRAGQAEDVAGEAFIIGGPERPSLNEMITTLRGVLGKGGSQKTIRIPAKPVRLLGHLCEIICRPFGISPPIFRRRVDFFINNRSYDVSKAERLLGFQPSVKMVAGLEQTAEWYRSQSML